MTATSLVVFTWNDPIIKANILCIVALQYNVNKKSEKTLLQIFWKNKSRKRNAFINKYPTLTKHLSVYVDQFIEHIMFHAIPAWRLRKLSLHLEQYSRVALLRRNTPQAVAVDLVPWCSRRTVRPAGTKQSCSFTPTGSVHIRTFEILDFSRLFEN